MIKGKGLQIKEDVGFWCLIAFIVAIPFPNRYGNLILIPVGLYWILARRYPISLEKVKESIIVQLFVVLFGIILISILTSENFNNQFSFIEKYLGLMLPVVFSAFKLTREEINKLLLCFVGSCFVCSIYSLISTFIVYEMSPRDLMIAENFRYFSWVLPETLGLKSNYYSLYVGFSLIILAESIFRIPKRVYRVVLAMVFCFLFAFLGILSSRTSFLAVVLLLIFYVTRLIFQRAFRKRKLAAIAVTLIVLVVLALQSPFLQSRIGTILYGGTESDPRYILFQCGWKIFAENFWFGVGVADVEPLAMECYKTFNDTEAIENQYNFHNVFLQLGSSTGIFGLLCFVALIVTLFLKAIRINTITHIGFIFLFSLACITESLLTRNKGVIFFATFSTLLFIHRSYEEDTSR
jgi:O-antigen ligase